MSEPDQEVVAEVKAFLVRHGVDPATVEATGLRFLFDDTPRDEIDAALAELHARSNGTSEVGDA